MVACNPKIKTHCNTAFAASTNNLHLKCNKRKTAAKFLKGSYINIVLNDGLNLNTCSLLDTDVDYQVCSNMIKIKIKIN